MSAPPLLLPSLRHSSLDDTADDDKGGRWRGVSPPPSLSCPPPHPRLPAVLALGILSQLSPPLFLKHSISSLQICSHLNQKHFSLFLSHAFHSHLCRNVFHSTSAADRGRLREQRQEGNQCYDNLNIYTSLSLLWKIEVSIEQIHD